jgi:hypothetical protein
MDSSLQFIERDAGGYAKNSVQVILEKGTADTLRSMVIRELIHSRNDLDPAVVNADIPPDVNGNHRFNSLNDRIETVRRSIPNIILKNTVYKKDNCY